MRADIQKRLRRNIGFLICTDIFLLAAASGAVPVRLGDERASAFVSGFQLGLLCALTLALLASVVKYYRALKDDAALKRLYYKENDERACYIAQQVGKSSLPIMTAVMTVAAIIAGYFSMTVFLTIFATVVLQMIVQLILTQYHTRRVSGESAAEG